MEIKCSYDQLVPISSIKRNPNNANIHPEKQIEVLSKIIEMTGIRAPLVVSKRSGLLVKGHGRLDALEMLDVAEVPVDFQEYVSAEEELKDMVADNEIARHATFDLDQFKISLEEIDLHFEDMNLEDFGMITQIDSVEPEEEDASSGEGNLSGMDGRIVITCPKDDYDEVMIFIKGRLLETSFEGVHVK